MYNRTSYYTEKEACIKYSVMKINRKTRKMAIPFFIYCVLLTLFAVFMLVINRPVEVYWFIIVGVLAGVDIMGLLLIIKPDLRSSRMEQRSKKELKYFSREEYYEVDIKEQELYLRKPGEERIVDIKDIKKAEEFENYIFLFLTPSLSIILDRYGFIDGCLADCKSILLKNGVKVGKISCK